MFSDDPQMTPIMRHLKEFSGVTDTAAVSVTNPPRKAIEFHLQIRLLNPQSDFFCVSEMSFAAMSFISLPLFDPQPQTITAHSRLNAAAALPPHPSLPLA